MTEAEREVLEFLAVLAKRAADLIERECAVEDGCDHHVALMLLAAGMVVTEGLDHPDVVPATNDMLPVLVRALRDEFVRRGRARDASVH